MKTEKQLLLGMYIHTHWGYNRPYAARSWTFEDWEGYLAGLNELGYNMLMVWPLLDCMPAEPTASDRAFLTTLGRMIDLAHERYGMKVVITACPNTIGNEKSAVYTFAERPYFVCEKKINPKDRREVEEFMQGRHKQFEPLRKADALAIIDSDPGGYIGSTNDEFVMLVKGQIEIFRSFNPQAELIYWMLAGWENFNRFWAAAQSDPAVEMWKHFKGEGFQETLQLMRSEIAEPWSVFTMLKEHQEAVKALGLRDKAMAFPYGLIEGEPSFPLTNFSPAELENGVTTALALREPRGIMANAQTHCLQLPHTYLFAHFAHGGTSADMDLERFAEEVLPGTGKTVTRGWQAIGERDPDVQRTVAGELRKYVGTAKRTGRLSGLLFGDADRFLTDLAMNLDLRAALIDLKSLLDIESTKISGAIRRLLDHLWPYQQRLGYVDAYGGPLDNELNQQLKRLNDDFLNIVLKDFSDWRNPVIRNGIVPRLLDVMEIYCRKQGG